MIYTPLNKFIISKCKNQPYLIKVFIRFLITHEAYEKFVFNYANVSNSWKNTYHDEIGTPNLLLVRAFLWGNTPEGQDYWDNINDLWLKKQKEMEEQEKIKFITNKMDENNMIEDFYVLNEGGKCTLINLKHIICIFPISCGGSKYLVCFENSPNITVDFELALKFAKLAKQLTWYRYQTNGDIVAINLSKIVRIYECHNDRQDIEISGLKYHDNKTTMGVHISVTKLIVEGLKNNKTEKQ